MLSPDGVAPSRMVSVSASVNLPLHHKVQKFSSGTGSPGWSWKKGRKTVVVVCGLFAVPYGKDRCLEEIYLEQLLVSNVAAIVQENSKDPGDIGKLVLNPRAPSKKTKSKQPPLGTAQLNDKNKSELTTVTQSQQMALLQRQSAGACDDT